MLEIAGRNGGNISVVRANDILAPSEPFVAVDLSKIQNEDACDDYFRREEQASHQRHKQKQNIQLEQPAIGYYQLAWKLAGEPESD
jgi:hypothetical protein